MTQKRTYREMRIALERLSKKEQREFVMKLPAIEAEKLTAEILAEVLTKLEKYSDN